jgi:hypothetical protein
MSASIDTPRPTGDRNAAPLARVAVPGITALLLLASLLGAGWLYVPANPAAKTPATTLSFADLSDLANSGAVPTSAIQESYFGWLGWTLAGATIAFAVAAAFLRNRGVASVLGALSVAGLVLTALGVRGALTWSQLFDQVENVRLGGYLAVLAYVVTLGTSLALVVRRR